MTVKQLISILETKKQDAQVIMYTEGEEVYGKVTKVNPYQKTEDMPYAKGDKPEIEEEVVLIEGYQIS